MNRMNNVYKIMVVFCSLLLVMVGQTEPKKACCKTGTEKLQQIPVVVPIQVSSEMKELPKKDASKEISRVESRVERTFAIIKPDAVRAGNSGKIIDLIELNGFNIVRMQKKVMTKAEAEKFYAVHKQKPFFNDLITFMTSGPVIVMALEKENAIQDWRMLMGATNPQKAGMGTLRKLFGTEVSHNAVHGSDAPETAQYELGIFFPDL